MTELLNIATALTRTAGDGQVSVLATVVRTVGSTYRRIGARLVALADGSSVGAVSAGCLETDIVLRAADVRASGRPELVSYDTRSPDDLTWGYGLGCGGMIELLLEPLDPEQAIAKAECFRTIVESSHPSVLATVIRAAGAAVHPGDQAVLLGATATLKGFDGIDTPIRATMEGAAREALRVGCSGAVRHVWAEQEIDVAYEIQVPRIRLCVCGAGPDTIPVVATAKRMGWHVTLIDHRLTPTAAERWPGVDCIVVPSPNEIDAAVADTGCDAAVVMSHHYERDLEFLAAWMSAAVPYIGMLGPRRRTEKMLATLTARGVTVDGAARERIRAPVGLDLGAETAEEIALAIVAEIQAVHAGREAGFLTRRDGPIHRHLQQPYFGHAHADRLFRDADVRMD